MAPGARRAALGSLVGLLALVAAVASVVLLQSPSETSADPVSGDPSASDWIASWGAAPSAPGGSGPSAEGFEDVTLRQVVHLSLGGEALRVRLSNEYGGRPLEVGAVTVAPRTGPPGAPELAAGEVLEVTFGGRRATTVPAGTRATSDPVRTVVADGTDLMVSIHLPGPTGPATWHSSGFATSFVAPGEATLDRGGAFRPLDTSRYFLTGVDVVDDSALGSVVFVGDSITDGAVSTLDADRRYPDFVADRLSGGESANRCGVVNAGIGGNRMLGGPGYSGEAVTERFERDVLSVPGVRSVVVLAGVNDIGGSGGALAAEDLIAAHRRLVQRAHGAGLRAVGATMAPFAGTGYHTPAGERDRRAVNRWIRASGAYDAVLDVDRVLLDTADPSRLWAPYDSGDHLHPNDAGFIAMADAINLDTIC